jgi:predicted RNase H-like HicB family nuclease
MRRKGARKVEFDFDFLFYREGDWVIAHCLQTDTVAQGDDIGSARSALREALEIEIDTAIEEGDLDRVFASPAPEEFWERIGEAKRQTYVLEEWVVADEKTPARLKDHVLAGV